MKQYIFPGKTHICTQGAKWAPWPLWPHQDGWAQNEIKSLWWPCAVASQTVPFNLGTTTRKRSAEKGPHRQDIAQVQPILVWKTQSLFRQHFGRTKRNARLLETIKQKKNREKIISQATHTGKVRGQKIKWSRVLSYILEQVFWNLAAKCTCSSFIVLLSEVSILTNKPAFSGLAVCWAGVYLGKGSQMSSHKE